MSDEQFNQTVTYDVIEVRIYNICQTAGAITVFQKVTLGENS